MTNLIPLFSAVPLDVVPLHYGPGGPPPFAPILGGFMFLLLLLAFGALMFWLIRSGKIGPRGWAGGAPWSSRPEGEARTILAERFARGDISSDEFLERASVLNWTPGTRDEPPTKKRSR